MCQQKDRAGREVGGVKTTSGRGTDSRAAELTDIGEGWVSSLEATVRNKVDSDSTFRPRGTIRGAWGKNSSTCPRTQTRGSIRVTAEEEFRAEMEDVRNFANDSV